MGFENVEYGLRRFGVKADVHAILGPLSGNGDQNSWQCLFCPSTCLGVGLG